MTPKERLIQCVRSLCSQYGVDTVAELAGVSAENLKQIVAGTLLPSGQPRGVGPTLQRKLDAAYVGWADAMAPALPRQATRGDAVHSRLAMALADRLDSIQDPDRLAAAYTAAASVIAQAIRSTEVPLSEPGQKRSNGK